MPLVKLYGIPNSFSQQGLTDLRQAVKEKVAEVEPLQLTPDQVYVAFHADMLQEGLGEKVVVVICGLNEKPERTEAVRNHLAQTVGERVKTFFPESQVGVIIETRDPRSGFWASES